MGDPASQEQLPCQSPDDSSHDTFTSCDSSKNHDSISPSISPPSSVSVAESIKRGSELKRPLDDARLFLDDLSNYLPLGCLINRQHSTHDRRDLVWREIREARSSVLFSVDVLSLKSADWIRLFASQGDELGEPQIVRVYVLPGDAGHRYVDRKDKKLITALESLVRQVDISPDTWNGVHTPGSCVHFDPWASADPGSLFYKFNNIPSPVPSADKLTDRHDRHVLERLMDSDNPVSGLKAILYPYQRRSASLMLQRECETALSLDPRLERRTAPDGSDFYYGARDVLLLRNPRWYDSCKGGILAESMGLGKTVICVALILASKGYLPKIPAEYSTIATRPKVASLMDMALSSINRNSVPWKARFEAIEASTGETMTKCIEYLHDNPPSYEIPQIPYRWNRNTTIPPPKRITLASTTVIVVPRNLCSQWQSELRKHVVDGALRVLVMDDSKTSLPSPAQITCYDVLLFSRTRFELEIRDGSDIKGRRLAPNPLTCQCPYIGATRTRDCICLRPDDIYDSPLKYLHFRRFIIDEGHFFSASKSTAALVANKYVIADHRWVVSGTPAKDLLGVEMDLYSSDATPMALNDNEQRLRILNQRKQFSEKDDTLGAIKSLGSLVQDFLKVRPWANGDGEAAAAWDQYIYRHEHVRKKSCITAFSPSLRQTLEAIVVKTRPQDVERDMELPPLTHNIVRLEPSFYDKLTANLFILVLTTNAVTSERTDADYLFHKNSQKARYQLIHNLRQSAFFWTGFSSGDIEAAIKHGEEYLSKKGMSCSIDDRSLLSECISETRLILASAGWNALSASHEIGLFATGWPKESAEHWSFDGSQQPLLSGVTQLLEAQAHVNKQANAVDPCEGLAGKGIRALIASRNQRRDINGKADGENPVLVKLGIPSSSVSGEPSKRRTSVSGRLKKKQSVLPFKTAKSASGDIVAPTKPRKTEEGAFANPLSERASASGSAISRANMSSEVDLPADSALRETRIIGSTSAKLSYLVSQVLKHYREEKILIFYDGDNVAYYIAQVLELLHVPHLIFAKSLTPAQKSNYIVRFDQENHFRVLLMDVQQAAFGLNLSSASRVFFINPVCRPHIEAQAIKRAHRIGQTRPVVVETLILSGTIEEKMWERAKRMTRAEHKDAKVLEDDLGIKDIIQHARPLPAREEEGYAQVALFEDPQQLWSRFGWATWSKQMEMPSQETVDGIAKSNKASSVRQAKQCVETDGSGCSISGKRSAHATNMRPDMERPPKRLRTVFVDVTDAKQLPHVTSAEPETLDQPVSRASLFGGS